MSSMFRSPNEVTSSDPESSSDGEGPPLQHAAKLQSDEAMSDEDLGKLQDAAASPKGQTTVPNLDATGHSNFIISSLLEEHCLNRAAQALNSFREDPEVRTLGRTLYAGLSQQLSGYGLVEQGYDGDDTAHFRQGYLQGLDHMALNILQDGVTRDSYLSAALDNHGNMGTEGPSLATRAQPGLRRMLTGPEVRPEASLSTSQADASVQLQHALRSMVTKPTSIKGPLTLQPANNHFIHASRYSNDFAELGFLGKGGYGKVYHVVNHLDGQEYAIKKITLSQKRLKKLEDGGVTELEALLREIRTLAKLEHSNVVRYFGGWIEHMGTQPAVADSKDMDTPRKMLDNPPAAADDDFDPDLCFGNLSDLHHAGEEDDGIIFDFSSEPAEQALLGNELDSKQRRASEATISSTHTKKSYVHSCDEEDEETDVVQHDQGIPIKASSLPGETREEDFSDMGVVQNARERSASIDSAGPTLTLHIQMSLHPISLSQYLSPDVPKVAEDVSLARRHCYHLEPSLRLMLAILSGVEYLHTRNYVHRDLKPGNIFLSICEGGSDHAGSVVVSPCTDCGDDGARQILIVPRIGDFGLVTDIARPEGKELDFMAKGSDGAGFVESLPNSPASPPFISPPKVRAVGTEFYRPSVVSDHPTEKYDVFSLGVIAVELLCKFTTSKPRPPLPNLQAALIVPQKWRDMRR